MQKLPDSLSTLLEENKTVTKQGVSQWEAWSISCLQINEKCVRIRQRQCLNEDFSLCPTVDKFGVEDQFEDCDVIECASKTIIFITIYFYTKCTTGFV